MQRLVHSCTSTAITRSAGQPVPMTSGRAGRRKAEHTSSNEQSSDRDRTLEVVVLPVSDIDRSVAFYRDQVGFVLDHDTANEHMHVVQLTPPGSGCSIVFGSLPPQQ